MRLAKAVSRLLRLVPRQVLRSAYELAQGLPGRIGVGWRYCLAVALAKRCGDAVWISRDVVIRNWHLLELGDNVSPRRNCNIDAAGGIFIGNDFSIAHQSSLISFNHSYDNLALSIRNNPAEFMSIVIGDDVWIGAGARNLAGVRTGRRVVVAAGAVATRDVGDCRVVGGVPARELRRVPCSEAAAADA